MIILTLGVDSVEFWLDEYMDYLKVNNYWSQVISRPELFYRVFRHDFLRWNSYDHWKEDVKFIGNETDFGNGINLSNDTNDFIYSYSFVVGLKIFQSPIDQKNAENLFKSISDEYPQSKITTVMLNHENDHSWNCASANSLIVFWFIVKVYVVSFLIYS